MRVVFGEDSVLLRELECESNDSLGLCHETWLCSCAVETVPPVNASTTSTPAKANELLEILTQNARQPDREAIRCTGQAAAQISYLCRLREEALGRNRFSHPTGS